MEHFHYNTPMSKFYITKLAVTNRKAIAQDFIFVINDIIIYLEPVTISTNHICCNIVPLSLRHITFNYIHVLFANGHTGEYKTLYRFKLHLF